VQKEVVPDLGGLFLAQTVAGEQSDLCESLSAIERIKCFRNEQPKSSNGKEVDGYPSIPWGASNVQKNIINRTRRLRAGT